MSGTWTRTILIGAAIGLLPTVITFLWTMVVLGTMDWGSSRPFKAANDFAAIAATIMGRIYDWPMDAVIALAPRCQDWPYGIVMVVDTLIWIALGITGAVLWRVLRIQG